VKRKNRKECPRATRISANECGKTRLLGFSSRGGAEARRSRGREQTAKNAESAKINHELHKFPRMSVGKHDFWGFRHAETQRRGIFSAMRRVFRAMRGVFSAMRGLRSAMRGLRSAMRGVFSAMRGIFSAMRRVFSAMRGIFSAMRGVFSAMRKPRSAMRGVFRDMRGLRSAMRGVFRAMREVFRDMRGVFRDMRGVFRDMRGLRGYEKPQSAQRPQRIKTMHYTHITNKGLYTADSCYFVVIREARVRAVSG
jgi:hypothetical protein